MEQPIPYVTYPAELDRPSHVPSGKLLHVIIVSTATRVVTPNSLVSSFYKDL